MANLHTKTGADSSELLTPEQISDACTYGERLRLAVHDRPVQATRKVRASAGCFSIGMQHHRAIVVLLEKRLYSSAATLLRPALEAYVRGQWLSRCASDLQATAFLDGGELPKISELLEQLERDPEFAGGELTNAKKELWNLLCDYTHTGGIHVRRWNTLEAIESAFDASIIREFLRLAEITATLSALELLRLGAHDLLAVEVCVALRERMEAPYYKD